MTLFYAANPSEPLYNFVANFRSRLTASINGTTHVRYHALSAKKGFRRIRSCIDICGLSTLMKLHLGGFLEGRCTVVLTTVVHTFQGAVTMYYAMKAYVNTDLEPNNEKYLAT